MEASEEFKKWFESLKTIEESRTIVVIPMEVAIARRSKLTEENLGWKLQIRQEKLRLW